MHNKSSFCYVVVIYLKSSLIPYNGPFFQLKSFVHTVHVHMRARARTHTHVCLHMYIYSCTYVCVYVCTHMYVYIRNIHMFVGHTYICHSSLFFTA